MKLAEVAPHINPDGDLLICHDVAPMPWRVGLIVLCDRPLKDGRPHTGKHMHRTPKGAMDWWGPTKENE